MRTGWMVPASLAAVALLAAGCGGKSSPGSGSPSYTTPPAAGASSTTPPASTTSSEVKTAKIDGVKVLVNSKGLTLYWFAPDTATKSKCDNSCAAYWPPVAAPVTAGPGVKGTIGEITRKDGTMQATYDGHPLYTYVQDTAPGMATGNDKNLSGGFWYEMTANGKSPKKSGGKSGSGGSAGW